MSEVSFGRPELLTLLALVPLAYAVWAVATRRGQRRVSAVWREGAPGPRHFAWGVFAVALALAITAAAQPRWGTRSSEIPREGADLVIVLDVSRSMAAADVAPNRLEASKRAIDATLARLGGDRVGLVIFAGSARLRFPLTTDFAAASQVVRELETGTALLEGGTDAASGLSVALDAFEPDRMAGSLILLITDGDNLSGDFATAASQVREAGVELLVAGSGTAAGSPVPVFDRQRQQWVNLADLAGNPIVSRLDEAFLRALAAAAGGRYLGSDPGAIPGAVDGRLTALKRAQFEQQAATLPIERYQWFAGAAIAALVLGSIAERLPRLSLRRSRRGAAAGVAAFALWVVLAGCATEAYQLNEDAIAAYEVGDYDRAIELFTEVRQVRPSDAQVTLNLAAALHAAGRYEEASLAARRALESPDPRVRGAARASIGQHRFAVDDLRGALESFREALIENPADEASRHNYEVVWRLLLPPPEPEPPAESEPGEPGEGESGDPGEGEGEGEPNGDPEDGQPGPGEGQQPAEGQPGEQQPQPGNGDGGRPDTPLGLDQAIQSLEAEITRLVEEAGETPTAAEALRILELLAERARLYGLRDAFSGGLDPSDY